jgi:4,5-dihydroxyphthalate decarboxylase
MSDGTLISAREISLVCGNYPHTIPIKEGRIGNPHVKPNFIQYDPVHDAFDAMVESQPFDVCEMAIATYFQALDNGKPIRLMPVVMMGRFHHGSLWYNPANGPLAPADLKGHRVGLRAYTQTTGLWVRGILHEQYGVSSADVTWVTTEKPHVAEYTNPPNVELLEGASFMEMLRLGDVAAVISGKAPGMQHLIPNIDEMIDKWHTKHQTVPINHMVVVKEDLLKKNPDVVLGIYDMFKNGVEGFRSSPDYPARSAISAGVETVWEALRTAMEYAHEQKLISRIFDKQEIFGEMVNFD